MNNEKVYTFHDPHGNPVFVKESELTKEHIREHLQKILEVFNKAPLLARDYFTRAILQEIGVTEELLKAMGLQINLSAPTNDDQGNSQSPGGLIIQP